MKTVHEVSRLTGVSIRALQYYDRIGLLRPSARTAAGYRLYGDEDIAKLRQILLYRDLEFPLKEIRELLSLPQAEQKARLSGQIRRLAGKKERLEQLISYGQTLVRDGPSGAQAPPARGQGFSAYFDEGKVLYSVKAVFKYTVETGEVFFEESVLLFDADSFDEAYDRAEQYVEAYGLTDPYQNVFGETVSVEVDYADCFSVYPDGDDGMEVYSRIIKNKDTGNGRSVSDILTQTSTREELIPLRVFWENEEEYRAAAKARWGDTDAYKEYEQKTAGQSAEEQKSAADGLMKLFGVFGTHKEKPVSDPEVQAQVKALQAYITAHYYTCTDGILRGLGGLYAAGGELTENIDRAGGPGTAAFVSAAISEFIRSPEKIYLDL